MTISCLQGGQVIAQLSGGTKINLEIQKILYFANMLYIGENQKPLIESKFLTWRRGPAVEKLHYSIKEYRGRHVPTTAFRDIVPIMDDPEHEEEVRIIKKAYERFGKYSARKLVQISHWPEGAWQTSIDRGHKEIDDTLILDEFNARNRQRR